MTTNRQLMILELVIDEYVKTGKPISSQQILDNNESMEISSALIRSEMLSLEKEGYIKKAYKSAGRIPTNKAFEYHIKNSESSSQDMKELIKKLDMILENRNQSIDKNISSALNYINEMTNTLSVFKNENSNEKLEDLKVYSISENKAMILVVTNTGGISNNEIFIDDMKFNDLEVIINIFSERLKGTNLIELEAMANNLKQLIVSKVSNVERKYQDVIRIIFSNIINSNESYSGTNSLVHSNHVTNEQLTQILDHIENQTIWDLLNKTKSIERGTTNVSIDIEGLEDVSFINKDLSIGEKNKKITLIGSKKQNYKKVFTLLDHLEKRLKGGDK